MTCWKAGGRRGQAQVGGNARAGTFWRPAVDGRLLRGSPEARGAEVLGAPAGCGAPAGLALGGAGEGASARAGAGSSHLLTGGGGGGGGAAGSRRCLAAGAAAAAAIGALGEGACCARSAGGCLGGGGGGGGGRGAWAGAGDLPGWSAAGRAGLPERTSARARATGTNSPSATLRSAWLRGNVRGFSVSTHVNAGKPQASHAASCNHVCRQYLSAIPETATAAALLASLCRCSATMISKQVARVNTSGSLPASGPHRLDARSRVSVSPCESGRRRESVVSGG